jgi:hypothetical protein
MASKWMHVIIRSPKLRKLVSKFEFQILPTDNRKRLSSYNVVYNTVHIIKQG